MPLLPLALHHRKSVMAKVTLGAYNHACARALPSLDCSCRCYAASTLRATARGPDLQPSRVEGMSGRWQQASHGKRAMACNGAAGRCSRPWWSTKLFGYLDLETRQHRPAARGPLGGVVTQTPRPSAHQLPSPKMPCYGRPPGVICRQWSLPLEHLSCRQGCLVTPPTQLPRVALYTTEAAYARYPLTVARCHVFVTPLGRWVVGTLHESHSSWLYLPPMFARAVPPCLARDCCCPSLLLLANAVVSSSCPVCASCHVPR